MGLPKFRLDGATTIITGAGSGIGAGVAFGLAAFGAKVACLDLDEEGLQKTVRRIEDSGGIGLGIPTDVTSERSVTAACALANSDLGPVNTAFNCAGVNDSAPAKSMPLAQWRRLIDTNLTGVFLSCRAEYQWIVKNGGGSIVNVGSISATIANRGLEQAHYNSAKAGVVHLSRSLALEWAADGVRVNALSPGYTLTPMAQQPEIWEHVKDYVHDIPMQRWAEVDELTGPAVFLLSGASSYCTGVNLLVDGGAVCW
jgi:NAD(P)-dependent dehydrogenase (short-subunit alcohol dehydrogenase family)